MVNHANVNKCGEVGWSPLHAAAYDGKQEAVRLLMAKGGNEMAKERHGQTPIDIAIRCGHETCVILMGGVFPSGNSRDGGNDGDGDGGGRQHNTLIDCNVAPTPAGAAGHKAFDNSLAPKGSGSLPAWKVAARRSSFRRVGKKTHTSRASARPTNGTALPMWDRGDVVRAMYDFTPESRNELALVSGQEYIVLKKESSTGWTFVKTANGQKGLVPSTYITLSMK